MDDGSQEQTMPVPIPDLDSQPFWDAVNRRELRLERCDACGELRYPPRPMCPKCQSLSATWHQISGHGRVYSWVIPHHPVHPLVRDKVPYVVALVELDEGPRMVTRLVDIAIEEVREGLEVEVRFDEIAAGVLLPNFQPAVSL
jgi:uncharacterized OB-fold protein